MRANVITVDGTSISRRDFEHDISALSSNSKLKALDKQVATQGGTSDRLFDTQGKATRVLTTSWLNRLANQIVIDHEFKALHLTITATDLTEGKSQFAQLFATSSATGTALVAQFPKWFQDQETAREARLVAVTRVLDARHPITQAQMLAFYKKNVGSLCPSGINVAHILVKTLPEAQAIEAQLAAGAKFAALAKAKSIDTGSATKGGSLGCFATGQFVAEFEQAAQKAKVGVPTAPVHSQFGYHVILTTKYVPPTFAVAQAADPPAAPVAAQPGAEVRRRRPEEGQGARRPAVRHVEREDLPSHRAEGAGGPQLEERDHHAHNVSGRVVVVVGLGPAGADMMLPAARARSNGSRSVSRAPTAIRPSPSCVAAGLAMTSFDDRYESAPDLDAVYTSIVDALLDAARAHGEIAYAVPGSPAVAEHTVVRLHERAASAGVEVDVIPGLSFADLAWARLGIDSFRGAHVVDAPAASPRRPPASPGRCSSRSATAGSCSPT